jgi:AraC-like DNA-binding protein
MKYSSAADVTRRIKVCLATEGFDVDRLFRQAGLDRLEDDGKSRQAGVHALSDKLSHLWESLSKVSGDPMLGFKVTSPHPLSWIGVLGHIMMASPNLKTAAQNMSRYSALVSPTLQFDIETGAERVSLVFHLFGGKRPVPQQRYDFTWNMLMSTLRFVSGNPALRPVRVDYAFPQPADAAAYAAQFGCPVRFGMQRNSIEFSSADLLAPIPTANPLAAEGMYRLLDERLAMVKSTSCTAKVRNLLATMIEQGGALREAVAERLLISERTLQRRLADEDTDFSTLVDEVRCEIAAQYLGSDKLTLKMLSYKLGFSDPSAFYRACQRWFGRTPGHFQRDSDAAAAFNAPRI